MKMGDFVTIGQNCIVEAVSIGNGSEIEDDCIIVCLRYLVFYNTWRALISSLM
jgi:acetyltransferase-like isoleucine patch superfamily enzyme